MRAIFDWSDHVLLNYLFSWSNVATLLGSLVVQIVGDPAASCPSNDSCPDNSGPYQSRRVSPVDHASAAARCRLLAASSPFLVDNDDQAGSPSDDIDELLNGRTGMAHGLVNASNVQPDRKEKALYKLIFCVAFESEPMKPT